MRVCIAVVLLTIASPAKAQNEWPVTGVVLDPQGARVPQSDVSPYWSANGWQRGAITKLFEEDRIREIWSHEGQMSVAVDRGIKTDASGQFSFKFNQDDYKLLVMDQRRQLGAIVVCDPKRLQSPITVTLRPLVRVHGTIRVRGVTKPPEWTNVYASLPFDPLFPLGHQRVAQCGSLGARFEFRLPPGKYVLHAYDDPPTAETIPDPEIMLTEGQFELDLGAVELVPTTSFSSLKERSKARGTWGDYTQHYGQQPPEWRVIDARGVNKQVRLADLRGKWVLLYFWGPDCPPCLSKGLPTLSSFYESHAARRDQFELLSFCLDYSGELKSIEDVNRRLAPIVANVWGGKDLPFPLLLDNTLTTYERFGLEGVGVELLIDPEGNLVRGDHTTLAERLK